MADKYELLREDLALEFLECKGPLRHSWSKYNPGKKQAELEKPPPGGFWMYLRCTRCKTTRHTMCDEDGIFLTRHKYKHPRDYKLTEKGVTPNQLRVEWAHRLQLGKRS